MEEFSSNQNIESALEIKKSKIFSIVKNFFSKKDNLIIVGILFFAFILRIYFFVIARTQPLWWDEACYGSLAKNILTSLWSDTDLIHSELIIRPPLFFLVWAALMLVKIPESASRFILVVIPATFSVLFVYLISREVFNRRVAILSSLIFSVLWIHLFYSVRFLTDVPSLLFLFASIFFFIKANKQDFNYNLFTISLFLLSLSTLIRFINGTLFFVYLLMLFLSKNLLLNKKKFWISGLIGIFPILIFFIYNYISYQNIFPAFFGSDYLSPEETQNLPFAWSLLNYIPIYLQTTFFIFFIIGILGVIFEIVVGYNLIVKNLKVRNYFLIMIILIAIYSFFIFYMKVGDDRWLFIISLPLCCMAGLGIDYFYNFMKKYQKQFAIIIILVILIFGFYSQIIYANNLINDRKISFLQMRQGFEWIKENTPSESVIIGNGIQPYAVYYSERKYLDFPANESGKEIIEGADYLVMHGFTPQSDYMVDYIQENQNNWKPLAVLFFDEEQTQPALVIYERI